MKLYEISSEFQKILALIEECGEITPELMEKLDAISESGDKKIINTGGAIKNLTAKVEIMHNYIKDMQKRIQSTKGIIEKLENYLKYHMDIMKVTKVESPEFDVQLRSNQYSLDLFDQSAIPKEYIKVKETVSISRQDIIKDLKVGCDVPGARFVTTKSVLIK